MKFTLGLGLVLMAHLAQAGELRSYSTKTGQQAPYDLGCPVLPPIRQAQVKIEITQNIARINSQDGSAQVQTSKICSVNSQASVYEVPKDLPCITTQSDPVVCDFVDSSGQTARTVVDSVILIEGNKKIFDVYLSTLQGLNRHTDNASATAFDLKWNKMMLTLHNSGLAWTEDGSVQETVEANITFEDQNP